MPTILDLISKDAAEEIEAKLKTVRDKKLDTGKPLLARAVLLKFPRALEGVARASEVGYIKYGVPPDDTNYRGSSYRRYLDPVLRHMVKHDEDPVNIETGGYLPPEGMKILHLEQMAWNSLAVLENYLREKEEEENA